MSHMPFVSLITILVALAGLCQPIGVVRAVPLDPADLGLVPAVVYVGASGHIHEIALRGAWHHTDLTKETSAPPSASWSAIAAPFRRGDGVAMVVYQAGAMHHVGALYLDFVPGATGWQEKWCYADLTEITGAPTDYGGQPFGYVRADGISAVVFVGRENDENHIHELWLDGGWHWANLTDLSGAPEPYSNLFAYDRGDGVSAILYLTPVVVWGGGLAYHIIELRLDDGGWQWADLTDLAADAPPASSSPSAYVRSDGIPTVNYRGEDGHMHEIRLEGGWIHADLSEISGAPAAQWSAPFGFVRSDGTNTIVYSTDDRHIYQIYLDGTWVAWDTTSIPNSALGLSPVGYVRADGTSAIVYGGMDSHIQEIRLEEQGWIAADLTALAEAPDAHSSPRAYNRSAGPLLIRTYLPLVRR